MATLLPLTRWAKDHVIHYQNLEVTVTLAEAQEACERPMLSAHENIPEGLWELLGK